MWLIRIGKSIDGIRRGYIGGSALSLFIIKAYGLDKGAVPTLDFMRGALVLEEGLLAEIPVLLNWLLFVFQDYHDANVMYLKILELLAESQRPSACSFYW